jgi:16S rRNA (cytosine1402-N4)-methyltransferase
MSEYHTSVLLDESVSALIGTTSGIYADATFGGGGHTSEILRRLSPEGRVIAFDRDSDAIANKPDDPRLTLIRSDFRWMHNHILWLVYNQQMLIFINNVKRYIFGL